MFEFEFDFQLEKHSEENELEISDIFRWYLWKKQDL
jgi:hypothetical protein